VIVLETLLRRWYVVAFVAGYFAASIPERGWKATTRFAVIATGIAFAAEYSSTRNGFPFSHYSYTGSTRGDEVYLSNIPAFVPAGYAVMIYAGRSVATLLISKISQRPASGGPLRPGDRSSLIRFASLRGAAAPRSPARSRAALVVLGAIATMAIDVIVDPVSVRGSQWFLGDLFRYATPRPWFGVPLANFAGWVLVAAVVIALDLLLSRGQPIRPAIRGLLLAAAVIAFDVAVAFAIGATLVGFAALAVVGIMGLGSWLVRTTLEDTA